MKKIIAIACTLTLALPLVAAAADKAAANGKDLCLLNSQNCPASEQAETLPGRIAKIRLEINKGTAVYTGQELNLLKQKLEDDEYLLNTIISS
ncbi:MAG TPA: hypothetical protein VJ550_09685 [Geomonas sp.]|nr:hypothetical protein [Geomonas sp.]